MGGERGALCPDVRVLLGVVLEAVSPPSPATEGDRAGYLRVLDERVAGVRAVLGVVLSGGRVASVDWLAQQVREVTPAGRYTVGPPVYGRFLCVRCGESALARRDVCDACAAPGVRVVRLDREAASAEHHAPAADAWPAPHPEWAAGDVTTYAPEVYVRAAGGLTWRLHSRVHELGTGWFLAASGLELASPPLQQQRPGLDYRRQWVVLDIGGRRAEHNRTGRQAQVMADRFIAGYLAARTASCDEDEQRCSAAEVAKALLGAASGRGLAGGDAAVMAAGLRQLAVMVLEHPALLLDRLHAALCEAVDLLHGGVGMRERVAVFEAVGPPEPAVDAEPVRGWADRVGFCAALRELAEFLQAHPALPLPSSAVIGPFIDCGDDESERAEVDRIAGILGVEPATAGARAVAAGATAATAAAEAVV